MKSAYLKYYASLSPLAPFVFLKDALLAGSPLERSSRLHRQKDYVNLGRNPHLLPLHRSLNELLLEGVQGWKSLDYGYGYFYQGYPELGVTGFRNVEKRGNAMQLREKLRGKRVLEIGCNTGFLSAYLAPAVASLEGFDVNPYLIRMAEKVAEFLGQTNVRFSTASFESWPGRPQFDAVISFANHDTHDQNTVQSRRAFFGKCAELVPEGGLLLFESHPPKIENEKALAETLGEIERHFTIRQCQKLTYGPGLDADRTFLWGERKGA